VADPAILLASGSPRRLELLARLGVPVEVVVPDVDETPRPGEPAEDCVARLAATKAATVASDGRLVVAADTVVVVDGEMIGKPADDAEATAVLRRLSGREHQVVTGVHLRRHDRAAAAIVTTTVRFRRLAEGEIAAYVATGEPRGKAGSYALQGLGGALVECIDGSDSNVIGLPLSTVVVLARSLGVELLVPPD
jgi:septum formation protein